MKTLQAIRELWRIAWPANALALALVLAPMTAAADLEIGDAAPGFTLQGSDGKVHDLAAYRGRAVVLAWFPKAFTGG